jgi:hypothetical protein
MLTAMPPSRARRLLVTSLVTPLVPVLLLHACGDPPAMPDDASTDAGSHACEVEPFEVGDANGHADPLGVGAGQARAGRVRAEQLPAFPSGLEAWEEGDFVLANEHVALVIEDAGDSELYDPWGGRPVGVARVEGGALVEPGDFGEILILLGRMTPLTRSVSVIADGRDGGAAIVRAEGILRPLPFFESVTSAVFNADLTSMIAAIDYVLEPGARHVDVFVTVQAAQTRARTGLTMHAFMHTPRMPPFGPGVGFDTSGVDLPWVGFADEGGTSFAYVAPGQTLGSGLSISGFVSFFAPGLVLSACRETRLHHAQIVIGGPGVDGLMQALAETSATAVRTVSGVVRDASGNAAEGVWVLGEDDAGFVTRDLSDAEGRYAVTVPAATTVRLTAFRRGDRTAAPVEVAAAETSADLTLPEGGFVHVRAREAGTDVPLPVRVQLLPVGESAPSVAGRFGVPSIPGGRIQVDDPSDGDVVLRAPAGTVRVVVSRGYEYELVSREVTVSEGETVELDVALERVIDTANVQCGDFHIHTHRSNDSGDDARLKLRSAVADGLELPVRSEHEYTASFQPVIETLGLGAWAYGVGSIEMTSFEQWGHMGVVPLTPLPGEINAGAPRWQRYPTLDAPDQPVEALSPVAVFEAVRQRPEAPVVIINHPRGSPNYFDFVGFDPVTGGVARSQDWDEEFTLVEVFNDKDWRRAFDRDVRDWLSLLDHGRRVFAVGSSDSHSISSSPVGYPRTCLEVGTDDPSALTPELVRDALAAGHGTISGGVYVDTWVGEAGPGDEAGGLGERASVRIRVQAASWIDVDRIDVVVDGAVVQQIDIVPERDADPMRPTTRFDREVEIDVSAAGSYVIVAAYGDAALEPVHPGRIPFGVANPIFLRR